MSSPSTSNHNRYPLTEATTTDLRAYFPSVHHEPSTAMWSALSDQAKAMEDMANGVAKECFYLSALDPGIGKTQTLYSFVRNLVHSEPHKDVGVLICLGRLEEVENFVNGIKKSGEMPSTAIAVLTSNEALNALGHPIPQEAQVLVTTQQRIEKRQRGKLLSGTDEWNFKGKPRAVRVWDETFIPGRAVTLDTDAMAGLFGILSTISPELRERVKDTFNKVEEAPDGSTFTVPDFAEEYGISIFQVIHAIGAKARVGQKEAATDLWHLSGRTVSVRRCSLNKSTLVDYRETLPPDLAPMLILDASGRVRSTYKDLEARGLLVRLREATKRYDNLTINVWDRGGGKSAFAKHGEELCKEVARMVLTKPEEPWLIITHKPDPMAGDYERCIRQHLQGAKVDVEFITWGNHMATNAFVDRPNVILAGTLFYSIPQYEGVKRTAAARRAPDGPVSAEEIAEVRLGEFKHHVLQALCRGSVRRCIGASCAPCTAYIIADSRHGFLEALADVFLGATVQQWREEGWILSGCVGRAVAYLRAWAETAAAGATVRFTEVAKAIGMSPENFKKDVRSHDDFQEALATYGIVEVGGSQRKNAFSLAA